MHLPVIKVISFCTSNRFSMTNSKLGLPVSQRDPQVETTYFDCDVTAPFSETQLSNCQLEFEFFLTLFKFDLLFYTY